MDDERPPPSEQLPAAQPIRASDSERERVVELLSEHAAAGRLTLAELEERAHHAYHAKTHAELAVLTRDLPERITPPKVRRKVTRWFVAIMGGSNRRGRFRLSGSVNTIAIMGGDNLDLRDAEVDGDELVINAFAVMGGTDIYVPDSVEVVVEGFSLMGGNDERGSRRPARHGAPLIRIRAYSLMGGIDVWRLPTESRGKPLKEARRAAKQLERGLEL
ncbi:DUF1707 SHOCT-like domain-containing protein [Actinopolymorpha alba]|uniref:DUF1707 SHOCT-like domain-containing protein n=1 Tax=Actinopolymorpha alba TaxID=533267 RepID=UPI00037E1F9D|nr:DUF1707 domain-containing protein [Actinopolymorpha alba]